MTFPQHVQNHLHSLQTLKMVSAQVVNMLLANNSPSQDSNHPDISIKVSYSWVQTIFLFNDSLIQSHMKQTLHNTRKMNKRSNINLASMLVGFNPTEIWRRVKASSGLFCMRSILPTCIWYRWWSDPQYKASRYFKNAFPRGSSSSLTSWAVLFYNQ